MMNLNNIGGHSHHGMPPNNVNHHIPHHLDPRKMMGEPPMMPHPGHPGHPHHHVQVQQHQAMRPRKKRGGSETNKRMAERKMNLSPPPGHSPLLLGEDPGKLKKRKLDEDGKERAVRLTIAEKCEILQLKEQGDSNREIARRYKVSEGSIRYILKNKRKLQANSSKRDVKRMIPVKSEDLERRLYDWISFNMLIKKPISVALIQEKARNVADKLNIPDFKASNGWWQKFSQRNMLSVTNMTDFGYMEEEESDQKMLREAVMQYTLDRIFAVDETGLFYSMLPNSDLVIGSEQVMNVETKLDKKRLSVIFSCNATGSITLPPAIVGSARKPRCFKFLPDENPPLKYFSKRGAWVNSMIFWEWLCEVFIPQIRKRTQQKVLLIVGNFGGCDLKDRQIKQIEDKVELFFLPNYMISKYQPMSKGIITTTKARFKTKLLQTVCTVFCGDEKINNSTKSNLPKGCAGLEYGNRANIVDAMHLISEAWSELDPKTVQRCWLSSKVLSQEQCSFLADMCGRKRRKVENKMARELNEVIDLMKKISFLIPPLASVQEIEMVAKRWMTIEEDKKIFEDIVQDELGYLEPVGSLADLMPDDFDSDADIEGDDSDDDIAMPSDPKEDVDRLQRIIEASNNLIASVYSYIRRPASSPDKELHLQRMKIVVHQLRKGRMHVLEELSSVKDNIMENKER